MDMVKSTMILENWLIRDSGIKIRYMEEENSTMTALNLFKNHSTIKVFSIKTTTFMNFPIKVYFDLTQETFLMT